MKKFLLCEVNIPFASAYPHLRTIAEVLPAGEVAHIKVGSLDHEVPAGSVAIFTESPTPIAVARPFKMVHAFHGLAEKGYTYQYSRNRAFDLILAPGPYAAKKLTDGGIDEKKIRIVGMPKLDLLFRLGTIPKTDGRYPTVLYAPTGLGDWRSSLSRILPRNTCNHREWETVIKVHPLDYRCREANIEAWRDAGAQVTFEDEPSRLFNGVDLLVSDSSSLLFEFAMTGRPVLKLDTLDWLDRRDLFDDYEMKCSFSRTITVSRDGEMLHSVIRNMLHSSLPAVSLDDVILPEHRDGKAGERAAAAIMELA